MLGLVICMIAGVVVGTVLFALLDSWDHILEKLRQLDIAVSLSLQEQRLSKAERAPTHDLVADFRLLEPLAISTQHLYRRALVNFYHWMSRAAKDFSCAADLDNLIVEYLYDMAARPGVAEVTVASLEKIFPRMRRQLHYAHATLRTVRARHARVFTTPMPLVVVVVIAYNWAISGAPRQAAALLVQWLFGLRPSEHLALRGKDLLPEYQAANSGVTRAPACLIQSEHMTKAGRPQFSIVLSPWRRLAGTVIAAIKARTPDNSPITNVPTVSSLTDRLKATSKRLQLSHAYTAHSPRAGWASESRLLGVTFTEIQEAGRWASAESLRQYLDIVSVLLGGTAEPRHAALANWLLEDFAGRFPWG